MQILPDNANANKICALGLNCRALAGIHSVDMSNQLCPGTQDYKQLSQKGPTLSQGCALAACSKVKGLPDSQLCNVLINLQHHKTSGIQGVARGKKTLLAGIRHPSSIAHKLQDEHGICMHGLEAGLESAYGMG